MRTVSDLTEGNEAESDCRKSWTRQGIAPAATIVAAISAYLVERLPRRHAAELVATSELDCSSWTRAGITPFATSMSWRLSSSLAATRPVNVCAAVHCSAVEPEDSDLMRVRMLPAASVTAVMLNAWPAAASAGSSVGSAAACCWSNISWMAVTACMENGDGGCFVHLV